MSATPKVADKRPSAALPCEWYVDDAFLEVERDRIFERTWQCAGLRHQLATAGDFITAQIGRVPIVVVCDQQQRLRAFVNVCLHRCSVIAHGVGRVRKLQCPYHAWTYDLNGRLVAAPRFNRELGFDFADFRLAEVQVDHLGPFVMVNLDPAAPSLAEQLDGLEERMAHDGMRFEGLEHAGRWEGEQAANWKVLVENFNECYHCAVAHPGFSQVMAVDPDSYRVEMGRWTSRAIAPLRQHRSGPLSDFPVGENDVGQYALLFPAFTLSQSPGPRRVVACWFEPITAGRTRVICETFVDPAMTAEEIAAMDRFSMQVAVEDRELVESVQRGLHSRRVDRAHLMADSESLVEHFDRLVADAMA